MMSWLRQNVLLPLYDADQHRGFAKRVAGLECFEGLPPRVQAAIQEQRIRSLLDHAYKTSPYYRLVFDQIHFRSVDWEFGHPIPLPELTRELIRDNMESLCSRTYRPDELRRISNGDDNSQVATALWRDEEAHRNRAAMDYHLNRVSGLDAGTRVLRVRIGERETETILHRLQRICEERILGRLTASLRRPDEAAFRNLLEILNRRKPEVLCGASSVLAEFAGWIRTWADRWHKPRLVIAEAESLSPEARQELAETFDCMVSRQYSCPEMGLLATECIEGERLHFHPMASYVSLVPAGRCREGSLYRLIVSDLLNYGMPLIRYDTGECVLFDETPCACGSWYPSVVSVSGTTTENLVLPDGTLIAGIPVVMRAGRDLRAVHKVQLVQKALDSMLLRFCSTENTSEADQELGVFRRNVEDALHIPLHWIMERVPDIPHERSGKLRMAICEVATRRD